MLLPAVGTRLRDQRKAKFHLKNLGVLITDSGFIPLRNVAVGMAIGYAGFLGVRNYVGKKDISLRLWRYFTRQVIWDICAAIFLLSNSDNIKSSPLRAR